MKVGLIPATEGLAFLAERGVRRMLLFAASHDLAAIGALGERCQQAVAGL